MFDLARSAPPRTAGPPRARRRGAAAIEFALWLPILLLFLSAVVDWGYYWNTRVKVARAVMEGTRSASAVYEGPLVLPPGSKVADSARTRTAVILNEFGISCPAANCAMNVNWCDSGGAPCGNPPFQAIQVRVQLDFTPMVGIIPTPSKISETFIMSTEYQRRDL